MCKKRVEKEGAPTRLWWWYSSLIALGVVLGFDGFEDPGGAEGHLLAYWEQIGRSWHQVIPLPYIPSYFIHHNHCLLYISHFLLLCQPN